MVIVDVVRSFFVVQVWHRVEHLPAAPRAGHLHRTLAQPLGRLRRQRELLREGVSDLILNHRRSVNKHY